MFDALMAQRESIEAELGEPLTWERLDDRRASRIALYRPGRIEDDEHTLGEIRAWVIDRLLRLKKIIGPRASVLSAAVGQAGSLPDPTGGDAVSVSS
jgi:hypothetical protein